MESRPAHSEALALAESDLDRSRGSVLILHGKGGKRRQVGMDRWAWEHLDPWLRARVSLFVGALLCVIDGPTQGGRGHPRPPEPPFAPRGPRGRSPAIRPAPAFATRTRSKWHTRAYRSTSSNASSANANLGSTSVYLQGIDNSEIIKTGSPVVSVGRVSAGARPALTVIAQRGTEASAAPSHGIQQHGRRRGTQENRPCHTGGPGRNGLDENRVDEDRVGDLGGDIY